MNEAQILKYLSSKDFTIDLNSDYTLTATLYGTKGFDLQLVFFKDKSCVHCRLLHSLIKQDIFSEFVIDEIEQLDFLLNSNRTIKRFYQQFYKEAAQ